jgi:hypothetical protein
MVSIFFLPGKITFFELKNTAYRVAVFSGIFTPTNQPSTIFLSPNHLLTTKVLLAFFENPGDGHAGNNRRAIKDKWRGWETHSQLPDVTGSDLAGIKLNQKILFEKNRNPISSPRF